MAQQNNGVLGCLLKGCLALILGSGLIFTTILVGIVYLSGKDKDPQTPAITKPAASNLGKSKVKLPDFSEEPIDFGKISAKDLKSWEPFCTEKLEKKNDCRILPHLYYLHLQEVNRKMIRHLYTVVDSKTGDGVECTLVTGKTGFQVVQFEVTESGKILSILAKGCRLINYPAFISEDIVLSHIKAEAAKSSTKPTSKNKSNLYY